MNRMPIQLVERCLSKFQYMLKIFFAGSLLQIDDHRKLRKQEKNLYDHGKKIEDFRIKTKNNFKV